VQVPAAALRARVCDHRLRGARERLAGG
jgi:hypothetical protein